MSFIAIISLLFCIIALLSLAALHFLSPEFHPGWRMISEYAIGKYKKVLTVFFVLWGSGTVLSAILLWTISPTIAAKIGTILIFVSGIGAIMGGLFDLKHPLHGLSFMLGVPTQLIGSLLVAYPLVGLPVWADYRQPILLVTHLNWISCVLMGGSMALLFSGFKKAGYPMGKDAPAPEKLPEGVIGVSGFANRLLVLSYIVWVMIIDYIYLISV